MVIGIGSGASVIISQFFGAKDYHSVKKAADTINIFLMVAGVLIGIVGILFSKSLLRLVLLPEVLIPQAQLYLSIYLGGMVVFFGFNGVSSILRGLGDSKTPLYFLIIATLFNIAFDFLFILVFKWGIAGAAIATIIAQGGAFVTAIFYLNRTHKILKYSLKDLTFNWHIFRQTLRIGLPSGIQQSLIAVGVVALNSIVNTFGTNVIAAYSAAGRIDSIAAMGTEKELIAKGIVVKEGGFLGLGKSIKLASAPSDHIFTSVDMRTLNSIPITAKKITLVTPHPANSYEIVGTQNKVTELVIKDSKAFWQKSKYLVISIEK